MITSILHTGVVHVNTIIPSHDTIIISILDRNSKHSRPNFTGFKDSLSLSFKDRCEEDYNQKWYWPDEISDFYVNIYTGIKHERLCTLSDAYKILNFFKLYHSIADPIKLIIHCKSGVGRSAAIAYWIGLHYNIKF